MAVSNITIISMMLSLTSKHLFLKSRRRKMIAGIMALISFETNSLINRFPFRKGGATKKLVRTNTMIAGTATPFGKESF
jgi:hypothetical protein